MAEMSEVVGFAKKERRWNDDEVLKGLLRLSKLAGVSTRLDPISDLDGKEMSYGVQRFRR